MALEGSHEKVGVACAVERDDFFAPYLSQGGQRRILAVPKKGAEERVPWGSRERREQGHGGAAVEADLGFGPERRGLRLRRLSDVEGRRGPGTERLMRA